MALLITKTLPQFDGSVGNQIFYFGSRQTLTADLTANGGDVFTNHVVLFNTAATLSNFAVQPPLVQTSKVWSLDMTGLTIGSSYAMGWLGSENTRNGSATLTYTSATAVSIAYTFYVTADTDDYPKDSLPYDSLLRLTYGSVKDPAAFTLSYPGWCLGAASNRGFRIHASIYTSSTFAFIYDVFNFTKTLFYNKRAGVNTPPVLQAQSFSLFAPNGTTPRTLLSTTDDTLIKIVLQGNASVPSGAFVSVFKVNGSDTISNFDTLIKGWTFIPGVPDTGSTTYDGIIKAPIGGAFILGGEQDYHFTFDKTLVEAGASYRVVIGSKNTDDANRGVFISAVFVGGATPPDAIYPAFISEKINDSMMPNDYGGDIVTCPQMRIRTTARFDVADYNSKVVAAYGSGSYAALFKTTYLNIIDAATGASLQYFATPTTTTVTGVYAEYTQEFRIEHGQLNSWAGKNLIVRRTLVFEYPAALTGRTDVHTDYINFEQFISVRPYENDRPSPELTSLILTDGSGNEIATQCDTDPTVAVVTSLSAPNGSPHVAFYDKKFYSQANLQEEDPVPPANAFAQLDSAHLFACDAVTTAQEAEFSILVASLTSGVQYRVSSIVVNTALIT